jgi:hypothetical protein
LEVVWDGAEGDVVVRVREGGDDGGVHLGCEELWVC